MPALDDDAGDEDASVENVGLMNMDFVPSTNRPPSGGSTTADLEDGNWLDAGVDGPAPGD